MFFVEAIRGSTDPHIAPLVSFVAGGVESLYFATFA